MADRSEFDRGFEEGLRLGRVEGHLFEDLPRTGALPGARFAFYRSLFDSYADYERQAIAQLRAIQHVRWSARRGDPDPSSRAEVEAVRLDELEAAASRELWRARVAVDAELEAGRGRACVVEAMRAQPQTPASVAEYAMEEFVAEDRRRGVFDWPARLDLGGADFGSAWSLEDPFRRWLTTGWRISWLCDHDKFMGDDELVHGDGDEATAEVYALEVWPRDVDRREARVWLLGKLHTRAAVDRALDDLQLHAMRERNSVVAAAEAVARISAEEGWVAASEPY